MVRYIKILDQKDFCQFETNAGYLIEVKNEALFEKFLQHLIKFEPGYVGIYGENAEAYHDQIDDTLLHFDQDSDVLTTWHDSEDSGEVYWEFINLHLPADTDSQCGYIVELGEGTFWDEVRKLEKD